MKKRLNSPKGEKTKENNNHKIDITAMGLYDVLGISRPRNYKSRHLKQSGF